MTDTGTNTEIWDGLYRTGSYLAYPYDVAVRLVKQHGRTDGFPGVVLDHGCGSGNHLELLVRCGHRAHGTEVSEASLPVIRARFLGANLPQPPVTLVDPEQELGGQLPDYDHAFVWGSVHYNTRARTTSHIAALIQGMSVGSAFILCVPSPNDVVARHSEPLGDGSRRFTADISGQKGAIVTVPENRQDLLSWCKGIEVRDCGTFGWTIGGTESEFFFVYGVRS